MLRVSPAALLARWTAMTTRSWIRPLASSSIWTSAIASWCASSTARVADSVALLGGSARAHVAFDRADVHAPPHVCDPPLERAHGVTADQPDVHRLGVGVERRHTTARCRPRQDVGL